MPKWEWPFDGTSTANVIAAGALVLSLAATFQSYNAVSETRKLTYQAQAAELRASAMKDYSNAFGTLLTALDRINLTINLKVEEPSVVQSLSNDEILLLARQAAGSFEQYRHYTTQVVAATPWWSKDLQAEIVKAGHTANRWASCFNAMSLRPTPLNADYFTYQRQEISNKCRDMMAVRQRFNDQSMTVVRLMREEIEDAWDEERPE